MNIAIAGYGISGRATEYLARTLGFNVIIVDGAPVENTMSPFLLSDLIVISPGIPPWSELYIQAQNSGVEMISELEFGYRFLPKNIDVIAITGTNGKTTTVEMTAELLNARGINAIACGNIGVAVSEIVADIHNKKRSNVQCLVIEVSSFQLEHVKEFAPKAAAITNIASDHLDRYHNDINEYAAVKFNIFNQVNIDNSFLGNIMRIDSEQQNFIPDYFKTVKDGVYLNDNVFIVNGKKQFINNAVIDSFAINIKNNLALTYPHNIDNLSLALNLANRIKGISKEEYPVIEEFISNFKVSPHRIEFVEKKDNITFINDSKATNPDAVITAIDAVCDVQNSNGSEKYLAIMLGGLNKEMDFSVLKAYANKVQFLAIYGDCKNELYDLLHDCFNCQKFTSFEDAFNGSIEDINSNSSELESIVMLSPGCASMDMFKNYAERGELFKELVHNLN
ncbi:UDP-N-acetylmuramoyl-L-alanine--D-glutamate ligase [Lentisphaerota bacterium WC36G]|nr:UDP-N-acetylmuramoyl-L-alanine--D-glutamate ligase [Lentisphaerae bacterium WC36]